MAPGDRIDFQTSYLMRYAIMAAVGILFSLWFLYDGLIGYPRHLPAARAYDELRDLDTEQRLTRWEEIAQQNGWPRRPPEKTAEEIESDIVGQYFWATLFAILGIPALYLLIVNRGRWIEETEQGLRTSWGQEVPFDKVKRLDKRRWAKKGIAKAYYDSPSGEQVFVFDDFKYDREKTDALLRRLESVLSPDQIVGGPPEAELEQLADTTAAATDAADQGDDAQEADGRE
ncbi:MAG: hypothetical protein D6753_12175 [Planctomycetota bacterium]|nr:MAG: hypothetical protein D6753_12175 [Planctomycetota bacterium]